MSWIGWYLAIGAPIAAVGVFTGGRFPQMRARGGVRFACWLAVALIVCTVLWPGVLIHWLDAWFDKRGWSKRPLIEACVETERE